MRRTTVWFGKSDPKISGLTKGSLPTMVQEPRRVRSAPHHLRCSAKKTMCYLQFIVLMSSRELGVALRAGLLAALKPRKRVFPLAGCHP
jgi:hypothetical protein